MFSQLPIAEENDFHFHNFPYPVHVCVCLLPEAAENRLLLFAWWCFPRLLDCCCTTRITIIDRFLMRKFNNKICLKHTHTHQNGIFFRSLFIILLAIHFVVVVVVGPHHLRLFFLSLLQGNTHHVFPFSFCARFSSQQALSTVPSAWKCLTETGEAFLSDFPTISRSFSRCWVLFLENANNRNCLWNDLFKNGF